MNFISVIIPIHKFSNFLDNAVKSVLACNSILEVVIVKDYFDSPELTIQLGLIDNIAGPNKCIIISNRYSKGVSGARNTGLDYSSGEYVVFLDYDDYFLPRRFDFDFCEKLDIYLSEYYILDQHGNNFETWSFSFERQYYLTGKDFFDEYNYGLPHLSCFTLNRNALRTANIRFDENLIGSEDTLFKLRCISTFGFKVLLDSRNTVIVRHQDNTTNNIYSGILIESRFKFFLKTIDLMNLHYSLFRHNMRGLFNNIKKSYRIDNKLFYLGIKVYLICFISVKNKFRINYILNRRFIK